MLVVGLVFAHLVRSATLSTPNTAPAGDCGDVALKSTDIIPLVDGKLSPDYVQGPWLPLPEEFPFERFTNRPRLREALSLLQQVQQTFKATANITTQSRESEHQQELQLTREGKEAIKKISAEIAQIEEREKGYRLIRPIQQEITATIQELSAHLYDVSIVYRSDSEIRFPVVERVTEYSIDLQHALRAKEDAVCKLVAAMPPAQLKTITEKYDYVIATIREKIDKEMSAATKILTPLQLSIQSYERKIKASRDHIGELSSRLHQAIITGEGFIEKEKEVKQIALQDEKNLVAGVELATAVQDTVIAETRAIFEEQMEKWYHIVSILSALIEEPSETTPSALQPPAALVIPSHDEE